MDTASVNFTDFLELVHIQYRDFVVELNDFFLNNNCKCEVKSAKTGYTVSYVLKSNKRTVATYVTRKTGVKLRIYPEHIQQYVDFLNTLPDKMKKEIEKSSVCKRLINPDDCNPKCIRGYDFNMDGEHYQKCRYMAFMHALSEESNPYLKTFLEKEMKEINA
jgi:hypothetical protein